MTVPAYSFKPRFADAILSLQKRQTIRARGKRPPPRAGDPLMLYVGMRTVAWRKLAEVMCQSVEPISIRADLGEVCMPRGTPGRQYWAVLDADELQTLARDDGFADAAEFFEFFRETHGATFSGYLIKW